MGVALLVLFAVPWIFLATVLVVGGLQWARMSESERAIYRKLADLPAGDSEWTRILSKGY